MDDPSPPQPERFCSYAATGSNDAFQAIFVCRTCCCSSTPPNTSNGNVPLSADPLRCICQACAEYCHAEHDVEYIGMGPCYCDCRELGNSCDSCSLLASSWAEAERLGLAASNNSNNDCPRDTTTFGLSTYIEPDDSINRPGYVRDVFRLSLLRDKHYMHQLQLQALELIQHSRETFWLGSDVLQIGDDDDDDDGGEERLIPQLSGLEQLACIIFRQHWQHYNLSSLCSDHRTTTAKAGAEWWVQVKSVSSPSGDENNDEIIGKIGGGAAEAIDLHYDKDEALAESFGLGAFPVLSTVTYLTITTTAAAPTVIFSHRYDESETNGISEMMLSHPAPHKHVVFDGRLLHGAPAHYGLRLGRQVLSPTTTTPSTLSIIKDSDSNNINQSMRITFLVNIWINHKPAAVETLPDTIRQALNACSSHDYITTMLRKTWPHWFEGPIPVATVTINADTTVLDTDRIELPFVGGKATWGNGDDENDEDDDDAYTVLSTYLPPLAHWALDRENDSLLVQFEPGFEALLQNPENYESDVDTTDA